jgi:hypothetical protein
MSLLHQMLVEVDRCMKERGEPSVVQINPITKFSLESEMRLRNSFNNSNAQKNPMVIKMLYEVDDKGKRVPNGWEIPVEGNDNVPMNQFWIGVNGYDISRSQIGRKIPRSFLKFTGRD